MERERERAKIYREREGEREGERGVLYLIAHAQSAGPIRGAEGRGKWAEAKEKR